MKRFLTIALAGSMLVGCSTAHNTKVRDRIAEEYGDGDGRKTVIVKHKSELIKEQRVQVEKPKFQPKETTIVKAEKKEEFIATSSVSVSKNTVEQYIDLYADAAMESMKQYGIPASIKLAQAILESGSGNGTLCRTANNHFGIKCKEEWTGETVNHTDDAPDECFRKYSSALESFNDHSEFLANRVYYKNLFTLDQSDYSAWAKGLKKAGYATDPRYPQKLISIIERYKLYEYDRQVLDAGYTAPVRTTTLTSNFSDAASAYVVQPGDTLYAISQKFNATIDEIKRLNNLSGNTISVGQQLRVQ